MTDGRRASLRLRGAILALVAVSVAGVAAQRPAGEDYSGHGAVGSFFGEAIQLCPVGVAPAACSVAGPALALYMTPSLFADGNFIGNDSFALGQPPFGPHTTAHGHWFPTSPTGFVADYTFMLNTFPPDPKFPISTVRFQWEGIVVDKNTLQGWVNMYFQPPLATTWVELLGDQFPVLAPAANGTITSPGPFVKDPSLCRKAGCPLVFKFTVKRVAPQ